MRFYVVSYARTGVSGKTIPDSSSCRAKPRAPNYYYYYKC